MTESRVSQRSKRPRDAEGVAIKKLSLKEVQGPLTPDLDTFIEPCTRETFFSEIYQQKALAVKTHPKTRETRLQIIGSLMEGFHPVKMLEQSNSSPTNGEGSGISVWMRCPVPGGAEGETRMQSIKVGPTEAKACYDAGHSLYFRGSETLESGLLSEFATSLGYNFGAKFRDGLRRSEIEVFAAHVGHKTDWHFDFQENFTIQLRGAKKWTIRKGNVQRPHRACAMHFHGDSTAAVLHTQHQIHRLDTPDFCGLPENIEEEAETVTLQAGDILYHPAGCWHKVEAVPCPEGHNSLSINMSFFPMTWGDLVSESMQQLMTRSGHWRERISFFTPEQGRGQLAEKLKLLRSEVATLDASNILPDSLCRQAEGQGLVYAIINAQGSVTESGQCSEWKHLKDLKDGCLVKRNPLGLLSRTEDFFAPTVTVPKDPSSEEDDNEEDDEQDDEETTEIEAPEGYLRFDYHANFISEESQPGAPHVHATFFIDPSMEKVVLELCALPPMGKGVSLPKNFVSSDLLKLLVYIGYLTPQ